MGNMRINEKIRFVSVIAFYISDYGYGHAARSVAIIRALCKRKKSAIKVIVCHSYALEFVARSLNNQIHSGQVVLRRVRNDPGYIMKPFSLEPDKERLKSTYLEFVGRFPQSVREEIRFLRENPIDLVIGDIPPVPFMAASEAGVLSLGISNFTWHTAYEHMLEERRLLEESYQRMDYFFALAGNNERRWGKKGNLSFGFFARGSQADEVKRIRAAVGASSGIRIVFFGLGMNMATKDLAALNIWRSPNCVFLVSSNLDIEGENIFHIPDDYTESQNYIAASDLVITKPGWGIVSEAVSFRKALILIVRNEMQEDRNTVAFLRRVGPVREVSWDEIKEYQLTEDILRSMQQSYNIREDSATILAQIVRAIDSLLQG
ncbi:hypothetical protein E4665_03190 [Sporolactobacillus shoreae]|uniref:Glycosyl transferase family 28 C-terminal domain-containing protein n=2 Tax=Sporolactobacillus shoreae TaxID=1465501 RepID=A0A4Z0GUM9_9BACL|nr:hypothetical protein E4665_03190 [Sporolactobacillus shoreae]